MLGDQLGFCDYDSPSGKSTLPDKRIRVGVPTRFIELWNDVLTTVSASVNRSTTFEVHLSTCPLHSQCKIRQAISLPNSSRIAVK